MDVLLSSPGLFFALGLLLSRLNKHTHLSKEVLRVLSIYLVISIGLKGGKELRELNALIAFQSVSLGGLLGLAHGALLFFCLNTFSKLPKSEVASLAAHYGSVSVGTFMVAVTFLKAQGITFEPEMYLLLVAMECPAILIALGMYQISHNQSGFHLPTILRKVFYHETIVALLFGLGVGITAELSFLNSLRPFYMDLFMGVLTFFMVCMGMEAGAYWDQIKTVGIKFISLGVLMQFVGAMLGLGAALLMQLSVGGVVLLMVLMGSASYIAAPCVMRESVPTANNSAILLLSLGITFPLNVLFGIKSYFLLASYLAL